jgi:hypothetical protein
MWCCLGWIQDAWFEVQPLVWNQLPAQTCRLALPTRCRSSCKCTYINIIICFTVEYPHQTHWDELSC